MNTTKLKKWFVGIWFASGLLVAIGLVPYFYKNGPGMDIGIYVNQMHHVVRGIDPFDVLKGKIDSEEYYPLGREDLKTATRNKIIDGNAPWTYAYSLPLSIDFPLWRKWQVWCVCQLSFLLAIIAFAFYRGNRLSPGCGLFMAAAALSVGTSFVINFQTGNYIMMVLAALAGMLFCLEKGRDVLAGVCWAVVVAKPQDGFLLAIPLLIGRRWKTVVTAGAICLVATWIASHLIGKPMIDLILEVPQIKSGAGYSIHESARLIPEAVCQWLVGRGWTIEAIQSISFAGGVLLCFALSYLVRKSPDWVVRVSPAVLCASLWTYMRPYDRCIFFVLQMALASRLILSGSKRERVILGVMMAVVFCSCLETINYCTVLLPTIGERLNWPGFAGFVSSLVSHLTSISSALLLCSFVVWCIVEHRRLSTSGMATVGNSRSSASHG